MDNVFILVFQLVVLIFSVVIHEVSHGLAADRLGDSTARLMGRLTLNPLKHLDPFGSIFLPLTLFFISGGTVIFGWAKPVPYNPLYLKNPRRDAGLIALLGPVSNLVIASIFGVFLRLLYSAGYGTTLPLLNLFFSFIVLINVSLAVFNLLPLPPLDGYRVLAAVLPASAEPLSDFLDKYGYILFIFFIIFGLNLVKPLIYVIFRILSGSLV